ncbi:MAG: nitroreductase [Anaerolineaceae bacterium]|nr:MAG: nitroreductase [Anaerolineaceae bacterium]
MDFFQIVEERRSMRKYADKPVEAEKLTRILETANKAPSGGNMQGYEIYIVRKLKDRQALVKAALNQEFLAEAPVALAFCANPSRSAVKYGERGATLYSIQDATIACAYAQLAAKALGLDTVWVGAFDEKAVSEILRLPEGLRPIILLPIGYAGKEPHPRPRRELKDLVHEVK